MITSPHFIRIGRKHKFNQMLAEAYAECVEDGSIKETPECVNELYTEIRNNKTKKK